MLSIQKIWLKNLISLIETFVGKNVRRVLFIKSDIWLRYCFVTSFLTDHLLLKLVHLLLKKRENSLSLYLKIGSAGSLHRLEPLKSQGRPCMEDSVDGAGGQ